MNKTIGEYNLIELDKTIQVENLITIHYFEYGKDFIFSGEKHDFWELLYIDKGSVFVEADDVKHTLKEGEVIFHKPMEFHTIAANKSVPPNLVVISFVCHSKAMSFFKDKVLKLNPSLKNQLGQIIRLAKEVFESPLSEPFLQVYKKRSTVPIGSQQLILINLEMFLVNCLRMSQAILFSPSNLPPMIFDTKETQVDYIVDLLKANLHQTLDLNEICKLTHLSPTSLSAFFKKHLNATVLQYYKHLKIQEAKKLIREDFLNFSEVASSLNYQSIHYFSRVFKKETGMSPSQYKSSIKNILET